MSTNRTPIVLTTPTYTRAPQFTSKENSECAVRGTRIRGGQLVQICSLSSSTRFSHSLSLAVNVAASAIESTSNISSKESAELARKEAQNSPSGGSSAGDVLTFIQVPDKYTIYTHIFVSFLLIVLWEQSQSRVWISVTISANELVSASQRTGTLASTATAISGPSGYSFDLLTLYNFFVSLHLSDHDRSCMINCRVSNSQKY